MIYDNIPEINYNPIHSCDSSDLGVVVAAKVAEFSCQYQFVVLHRALKLN